MNSEQPTPDDIRKLTKQLLADVTETEPEEIGDTDSFILDLDLDSLMALEVMVSLSKSYRIEIPEEEFAELQNVNNVVDLVTRHLSQRAEVEVAQAS